MSLCKILSKRFNSWNRFKYRLKLLTKNFQALKSRYSLLISLILSLFAVSAAQAQGQKQPVYFSGFVVDEVNSDPMPGVHMYIPKAGRGTATNSEGFFAMPTFPGDSIIISSIGYKKHYYVIPEDKRESYSVVIEMIEDTTALPTIEVFPYPTEELFKEAFLAMELPDEEKLRILRENLDQRVMTRLAYDLPMDGAMNFDYQMDRNVYRLENRTVIPTLQVLNPFAWARFIQSIKRGDFKKGRWKDE